MGSQDLNGGAQNSTYSHSLILFKRKNNQPIRKKIFFPPPLVLIVFCYYFSLILFFSSFFNLYIKLEKKRNILKEKKTNLIIKKMAHPSRRIDPQHLKDLKIFHQILRSETSSWTLLFC